MKLTKTSSNELYHFGIKGQRWGIRRYQNEDGSLTNKGKKRYRDPSSINNAIGVIGITGTAIASEVGKIRDISKIKDLAKIANEYGAAAKISSKLDNVMYSNISSVEKLKQIANINKDCVKLSTSLGLDPHKIKDLAYSEGPMDLWSTRVGAVDSIEKYRKYPTSKKYIKYGAAITLTALAVYGTYRLIKKHKNNKRAKDDK